MSLSTRKLQLRLQTLEARRRILLRRLAGTSKLAVGTVSWVDRKCGQPGCHCAQGCGHRQMQFLFAEEGRRRCKLVRRVDETRLEQANDRYRDFREDLKELAAIQKREHELLLDLMHARGLRYE